jgi:hypothetical protein
VLAAASIALAAGRRDYTLTDRTTTQRTLRFGGSDRRLEVRLVNGTIHVARSRGSEGSLEVRRTVRADTAAELARGREEVELAVRDGAGTVSAVVEGPDPACGTRGNYPGSWQRSYDVTFDLDVSVPAETALVLCTINGREITVDGTTGDFDVANVNGSIRLSDVRGSGSARTVNGGITASLLDPPRQDGTFKTVNGDVVVTWPSRLDVSLRLKTKNGGLFTDFDVAPDRVPPAVGSRNGDGLFVLKTNQHTAVRVGNGGPVVTLETLNGDVRVLRSR